MNLPDGYQSAEVVDFTHNPKTIKKLNKTVLLFTLLFIAVSVLLYIFVFRKGAPATGHTTLAVVVTLFGTVASFVFHELMHGFFMRIFSRQKVFYGIKSCFGYAGSEYPFFRDQYLFIALAPLVLLDLLIMIPVFFLPAVLKLSLLLILSIHIPACMGDIYVCRRLKGYSKTTRIIDTGTEMVFCTPKIEGEGSGLTE